MNIPKKTGRWILFSLLCAVLYFSLTDEAGLINLYRERRQTNKMRSEIQELNKNIDSLTIAIEKLKNDTTYIERIAREKLGMAKKGEKVYKFIEEK